MQGFLFFIGMAIAFLLCRLIYVSDDVEYKDICCGFCIIAVLVLAIIALAGYYEGWWLPEVVVE